MSLQTQTHKLTKLFQEDHLNPKILKMLARKPNALQNLYNQSAQYPLQLLSIMHQLFTHHQIPIIDYLKSFSNVFTQENLLTEPSQSENSSQMANLKEDSRIHQLHRKDYFVYYYSYYLMKLTYEKDLYIFSKKKMYPDHEMRTKEKLIWLYQLSNIVNVGIQLIEEFAQEFPEIIKFIVKDIVLIQMFVNSELEEFNLNYALLPNIDVISLHEIYQESLRFIQVLQDYQEYVCNDLYVPELQVSQFEEFVQFACKIKILNQTSFKKKIATSIPNEKNPYPKQRKQSIFQKHVKAQSCQALFKIYEEDICIFTQIDQDNDLQEIPEYEKVYEQQVMQTLQFYRDTEEDCTIQNTSSENPDGVKVVKKARHKKGISTFHN